MYVLCRYGWKDMAESLGVGLVLFCYDDDDGDDDRVMGNVWF